MLGAPLGIPGAARRHKKRSSPPQTLRRKERATLTQPPPARPALEATALTRPSSHRTVWPPRLLGYERLSLMAALKPGASRQRDNQFRLQSIHAYQFDKRPQLCSRIAVQRPELRHARQTSVNREAE